MKKLFTTKTFVICALLLVGIFILPKYFPALKGNSLLLILLLCPLMHIFMMGSHKDHDGEQSKTHSCCGGNPKEPESPVQKTDEAAKTEHDHEITK